LFNPPLLDLSTLGGSILCLKDTWHYLRFIFNRKLTFWQHINFYTNKALSTVKYMKMLSNSSHGLISFQKQLLYKICVLLITLYCYNLIILEWVKERNLVLGLTQENLIENSIQDCLSYILNYHNLYYYFSNLS